MALETLFQESVTTHSASVVGLAFLGGIVSSLLPCSLGMLPILIGYIGGYGSTSKKEVVLQVLLFVVGICLVMTVLGIAAGVLGVAFGGLIGSNLYYIIGVLAILAGLQMLEVIHLPLPQFVTKLPESKSGKIITPLILGVTFGLTASPCGTPFLAGILGFITNEKNILLGGVSLFAYALGQSVLLVAVGLSTGLLKHLSAFRQVGSAMGKVSAVLFIIAGLLAIAQGAGLLGQILITLHLI